MSIKALQWAFELDLPDPTAKVVLLALADHYNQDSECCWPSIKRLIQYTGATERTIQRAIDRLENLKLIKRHQRPRKTSIFQLAMEPRQIDGVVNGTPVKMTASPVTLTVLPRQIDAPPRQDDGLTLKELITEPLMNSESVASRLKDARHAPETLEQRLKSMIASFEKVGNVAKAAKYRAELEALQVSEANGTTH